MLPSSSDAKHQPWPPLEYGRKSDFPFVFPGFFSAERSMSQVLWGVGGERDQILLGGSEDP